jgi:hypothetical protein
MPLRASARADIAECLESDGSLRIKFGEPLLGMRAPDGGFIIEICRQDVLLQAERFPGSLCDWIAKVVMTRFGPEHERIKIDLEISGLGRPVSIDRSPVGR